MPAFGAVGRPTRCSPGLVALAVAGPGDRAAVRGPTRTRSPDSEAAREPEPEPDTAPFS